MGRSKTQEDVIAWSSAEHQGHSHRQASLPEVNSIFWVEIRDAQEKTKVKKPEFPNLCVNAHHSHKCGYKPG